jgi:myosin heavy subunit
VWLGRLLRRVNASISSPTVDMKTFIGILDIYGFEVFERNSFEQVRPVRLRLRCVFRRR